MREKEIEFLQMGKGEHHVLAHFFGLKWKYPQESYIPFRTVEAPHRFFGVDNSCHPWKTLLLAKKGGIWLI